jgi:SAM-dependent MidA family methyltransferase
MAEWPFWEMRVCAAVDQEIRALIHKHGRITFAQFMQACLYSPHGGFDAARDTRISTHFGTSPTSHPVFGALLARQLEQMWHLLGDPAVFHVLEVGSGITRGRWSATIDTPSAVPPTSTSGTRT